MFESEKYGFVNKNFFKYHPKNLKLTPTLIRGKNKRFEAKDIDEYLSRNSYYTYDNNMLSCDCPNFWKYYKCIHQLVVYISLKKVKVNIMLTFISC